MIERMDLFHLPFYKKEAFTGSDRGLRFWIGKTELFQEGEEDAKDIVLRTIVWPEPFAFFKTPDEKKEAAEFPFGEDGVAEAICWMNEMLSGKKENRE